MKKVLVFLLLFLIGLGLFSWIVKRVGWKAIKGSLFAFSGWQVMVIIGITLLIWLVGIWKYKFVFETQGYNFSFWGLGEILFASFAITYLFPTSFFGGEAFKVYAISKKFSLPWRKNLTVLSIEKLLSVSILLLFLILGIISFLWLVDSPLRSFVIIAVAIIAGLIMMLTIFYFKSFKKESILKSIFRFFGIKNKKNHYKAENVEKKIFHFFDFRKISMWKGLGLAFVRHFLILTRSFLLIFFLKGEINILIVFAVLFFVYLSYVFPFPAKIGSSEAAQVFAFSSLGLGAASGITFSFVLRGAEILIALFGFILLLKLGIKFFVKNKLNHSLTG